MSLSVLENLKDKKPSRLLVVYGGLSGIEAAIEADEKLKANKMDQVFDFICESEKSQFGSRSVRLEVGYKSILLIKNN